MKSKLNKLLYSAIAIAEYRINNIVNNLLKLASSIMEKLKSENQLLWIKKWIIVKILPKKLFMKMKYD